jgi:hypothetical protein
VLGWSRGHWRTLRLAAAALSATCAVIYLAIGAGWLLPVSVAGDARVGLLVFGLLAGGAFAAGCLLLLVVEWRSVWLLGAAFQVFAIVAYVQVAEKRDPPFEFWGIFLKVLQVVILVALALLAAARADAPRRSRPLPRPHR